MIGNEEKCILTTVAPLTLSLIRACARAFRCFCRVDPDRVEGPYGIDFAQKA